MNHLKIPFTDNLLPGMTYGYKKVASFSSQWNEVVWKIRCVKNV